MQSEGQAFSIWLLPDNDSSALLDPIIDRLANRYGTPGFAAHATLCAGCWNGEESGLIAQVDHLAAAQTQILKLETTGLNYTDSRFQFFYVSLFQGRLTDLQALTRQRLPTSRFPSVGLHVSLMYCDDFSAIDRNLLSNELESSIPPVLGFDTLAVVLPRNNDWTDVSNWETIHVAKLDQEQFL
jgi:hypothetical protein